MGGTIDLVTSVIGLMSDVNRAQPSAEQSGQTQQLKAEREAQEEAQRKREADERKRKRDKLTEARDAERRRQAIKGSGRTTLLNGGAGLLEEPEIATPRLKEKFGE